MDALDHRYLYVQDEYTTRDATLDLPVDGGTGGINNARGSTFLVLPSKRNAPPQESLAPRASDVLEDPSAAVSPLRKLRRAFASADSPRASAPFDFELFSPVLAAAKGRPKAQWSKLNALRVHAGAPERSARGAQRLVEYVEALETLEQQLPLDTALDIQARFAWFEAFLAHRRIVVTNCVQYEKAAVLYNLASVLSAMAASQRLYGDRALQAAATLFQQAAGVLLHVRDALVPRFRAPTDRSSDLSEPTLTGLAHLMLAQAHECFYERACLDHASSNIVSMVAAQTGDSYDLALRHLRSQNAFMTVRLPPAWRDQLKCKAALFCSVAHFHAPTTLSERHALGERITRLSVARNNAERAFAYAQRVEGRLETAAGDHLEAVGAALLLADTANFEEYRQTVVDARLLAPLRRPRAPLAAPVPFSKTCATLAAEALQEAPAVDALVRTTLLATQLAQMEQHAAAVLAQLDAAMGSCGLERSGVDQRHQTARRAAEALEAAEACHEAFEASALLDALDRVVALCDSSVRESLWILDHVDVGAFPTTPTSFAPIGPLRSAATLLGKHVAQMRAGAANLRTAARSILTSSQKGTAGLELRDPKAHRHALAALERAKGARAAASDLVAQLVAAKSLAHDSVVQLSTASEKAAAIPLADLETAQQRAASDLLALQSNAGELAADLANLVKTIQAQDAMVTSLTQAAALQTELVQQIRAALSARKDAVRLLVRCLAVPTALNESCLDHELPPSPVGASRDPLVAQAFDATSRNLLSAADTASLIDRLAHSLHPATPANELLASAPLLSVVEYQALETALDQLRQTLDSESALKSASALPSSPATAPTTRDAEPKSPLKQLASRIRESLSLSLLPRDDPPTPQMSEASQMSQSEQTPAARAAAEWAPAPGDPNLGKVLTNALRHARHPAQDDALFISRKIMRVGSKWVRVLPSETVAAPEVDPVVSRRRPATSLGLAAPSPTASSVTSSRAPSPAQVYLDRKFESLVRENSALHERVEQLAGGSRRAVSPSLALPRRGPSPLRQASRLGVEAAKLDARRDSVLDADDELLFRKPAVLHPAPASGLHHRIQLSRRRESFTRMKLDADNYVGKFAHLEHPSM